MKPAKLQFLSRAEQSRAEQSRAEQSRAEQSRALDNAVLFVCPKYHRIETRTGYAMVAKDNGA